MAKRRLIKKGKEPFKYFTSILGIKEGDVRNAHKNLVEFLLSESEADPSYCIAMFRCAARYICTQVPYAVARLIIQEATNGFSFLEPAHDEFLRECKFKNPEEYSFFNELLARDRGEYDISEEKPPKE